MLKKSKLPAPLKSSATAKFSIKVFSKSAHPKALKENVKLVLHLLINFFC
jgi:hypothetical protein